MTFISNNNPTNLKIGDRIELTQDVSTMAGTFTKGHRLICIGRGSRGYDFVDADGNKLLETALLGEFYKKL